MQQTLFKKAYNFSSFEVDHNFQTPTDVCDYMAKMVPQTANTILEPTPGLGNLVRAIEKHLPDHLCRGSPYPIQTLECVPLQLSASNH